jgi:hypothetical protein
MRRLIATAAGIQETGSARREFVQPVEVDIPFETVPRLETCQTPANPFEVAAKRDIGGRVAVGAHGEGFPETEYRAVFG